MSAKLRVTLWSAIMVLILSAVTLVFVLVINTETVTGDASGRLVKTVRHNVHELEFDDGRFEWDDIDFYKDGVFTTIFDSEETLILGATPPDVTIDLPFENGITRSVAVNGVEYYVYDSFVDMYVTGVWVRGVVQAGDTSNLMHVIIFLTCTLLPLLIIISVGGGWLIAKSAFKPMEQIMDAAESINYGDDLSARVNLTRGPSEMRRLSQSFDSMFSRLEASFNAEKQFTSDASHELRTPITVILAECDRARRKCVSREDFLGTISVIEEQGQKMSDLVQALLSLTRLEHGTERYPMQSAELSPFIDAFCDEFVPSDRRGISLETDIDSGVYARFNPALMSRVVQNLLENAYKYGRENGHIRLSLKGETGYAVLTVTDDGIGIAADDLDKIWQRFWQADSARSTDGSAGLGLAMVKEIAEFHHGSAQVHSTPGAGSTFIIKIPS